MRLSEWENLTPGMLVEQDLVALIGNEQVLLGEERPPRAKETTVELTIGSTAYFSFRGTGDRKRHLGVDDQILINPTEIVSVTTNERLQLPVDGYGRIYPKGRMATVGLTILSTNVDPGFQGHLVISILNSSGAPIKLIPGLAIAKLELTKLPRANFSSYSGSHGSAKDSIPFNDDLFAGEYQRFKTELNKKSNLLRIVTSSVAFLSAIYLISLPFGDQISALLRDDPNTAISIIVPIAIPAILWIARKVYDISGYLRLRRIFRGK